MTASATSPDVSHLLAAVASGDRAAFHRLYLATSPRLYGMALRLTRRRDMADDAMQDAYLRVWSRAASYRPERGTALVWMGRILRNTALDRLRREARPMEDIAAFEDSLPGPTPQPELGIDLQNALAALRPKTREAVLLSGAAGHTDADVAALMGVPLGTAKSWIRRGHQAIRGRLDEPAMAE